MEIHRYCGFFFTGCNRPSVAAGLNALRVAGLLIPLSLLALHFRSLTGLFAARLLSDVVAGGVGLWVTTVMTSRLPRESRGAAASPAKEERDLDMAPLDME